MRINEIITESTEAYQGLTFSLTDDDGSLTVKAIDQFGKELAYAIFDVGDDNTLDPQDLQVDVRFRGQGIAKIMYDYLTSHGYEIHRSYDQTDAGAAFWEKNRNQTRIWEDDLTELFEPGKDYQWSFTGSEEAIAVFHIGEVPYQFHAYTYPEENGTWEVEFKNAERGRGRTAKFGLTGTGNSAEVLSTVTDIMREFLQRYQGKVTALTFTADEQSRQSLYARMAKRLLPTWQLTQTDKQFILTAPAN
jgi:hypothetical protein